MTNVCIVCDKHAFKLLINKDFSNCNFRYEMLIYKDLILDL